MVKVKIRRYAIVLHSILCLYVINDIILSFFIFAIYICAFTIKKPNKHIIDIIYLFGYFPL